MNDSAMVSGACSMLPRSAMCRWSGMADSVEMRWPFFSAIRWEERGVGKGRWERGGGKGEVGKGGGERGTGVEHGLLVIVGGRWGVGRGRWERGGGEGGGGKGRGERGGGKGEVG